MSQPERDHSRLRWQINRMREDANTRIRRADAIIRRSARVLAESPHDNHASVQMVESIKERRKAEATLRTLERLG